MPAAIAAIGDIAEPVEHAMVNLDCPFVHPIGDIFPLPPSASSARQLLQFVAAKALQNTDERLRIVKIKNMAADTVLKDLRQTPAITTDYRNSCPHSLGSYDRRSIPSRRHNQRIKRRQKLHYCRPRQPSVKADTGQFRALPGCRARNTAFPNNLKL